MANDHSDTPRKTLGLKPSSPNKKNTTRKQHNADSLAKPKSSRAIRSHLKDRDHQKNLRNAQHHGQQDGDAATNTSFHPQRKQHTKSTFNSDKKHINRGGQQKKHASGKKRFDQEPQATYRFNTGRPMWQHPQLVEMHNISLCEDIIENWLDTLPQLRNTIRNELNDHEEASQQIERSTLCLMLPSAAHVINLMCSGAALTDALAAFSELPQYERATIQDLSYTTVRHLAASCAIVEWLVQQPLSLEVAGLLWVSIALWLSKKYPPHTLVDQAVEACKLQDNTLPASGLINAVLRRLMREEAAVHEWINGFDDLTFNHPSWWIERVKRQYPTQWQAMLLTNNQLPPLVLRVNQTKTSVNDYLSKLDQAHIAAHAIADKAIWLPKAVHVDALPGFEAGLVSVQDYGAQWAAPLLDVQQGMRVLDACAAPGGKSGHILELADCQLTALEIDPTRIKRIHDNLSRLNVSAEVLQGNAADPSTWWDGKRYDRILADVPCSASGIVRRHPDIRWLRRPKDLTTLAQMQYDILQALWQLLAPGGKLLYVTCSIFDTENQATIRRFLKQTPSATLTKIHALAQQTDHTGQLLPRSYDAENNIGHDGFFYALLERQHA